MVKKLTLSICCCVAMLLGQDSTQIGPGMIGDELFDYVVMHYKTTTTLGYGPARDVMYGEIDVYDGNQLTGVYSGFTISLDMSADPSQDAYAKGINCEHTWPQSLGAADEPQRSDIHHLFPTKVEVNSARGNDPFSDIPDENTDVWYRLDQTTTSIPSSNIDEYSEKENDGSTVFEVREDHKGNTARAMFYFYTMYQSDADENFWTIQNQTLRDWHYTDPVDSVELERTQEIAAYQDNKVNPFVMDSSLARRIWWPNENDTMTVAIENPNSNSHPESFAILDAYPNPFNDGTIISFQLPAARFVDMAVYDITGKKVKELIANKQLIGDNSIRWTGVNVQDRSVGSGIYFVNMIVHSERGYLYSRTKRILYIK